MKIVHLELSDRANIDTVQTWLDAHSDTTVQNVVIYGLDVYIFYTEL